MKTCDLKAKTFKLTKTCLWIYTFTCAEAAGRYSRISSTRYKCTLVFLKVLSWFIRPSGLWNKSWQGFQIQRNYCWCWWFLLINKNRFRPIGPMGPRPRRWTPRPRPLTWRPRPTFSLKTKPSRSKLEWTRDQDLQTRQLLVSRKTRCGVMLFIITCNKSGTDKTP